MCSGVHTDPTGSVLVWNRANSVWLRVDVTFPVQGSKEGAHSGTGQVSAVGSGLCDAILGRESVSLLFIHSSLASLGVSAQRVPCQKIEWTGVTREGPEQEPR